MKGATNFINNWYVWENFRKATSNSKFTPQYSKTFCYQTKIILSFFNISVRFSQFHPISHLRFATFSLSSPLIYFSAHMVKISFNFSFGISSWSCFQNVFTLASILVKCSKFSISFSWYIILVKFPKFPPISQLDFQQ